MKARAAMVRAGLACLVSVTPLWAQTGSINGTVTDAVSLLPVGDTTIYLAAYGPTGVQTAGAQLDATGHYTLQSLPAGQYFVRVYNTGTQYVTQLHQGIACVAADCPVTSGTPVTVGSGAVTVDFALARAGGIAGTVRRSADNSVVGSADVLLYNNSTSPVATTRTASAGTYEFTGLPAGNYFVRTTQSSLGLNVMAELYDGVPCPSQFPDADCRIASGTPVPVSAGTTTSGIDFALDPLATITGTVVADGSGMPLANVPLMAFAGEQQVAAGFTDANGQYQMALPAGQYRVRTALTATTAIPDNSGYVNEWNDGLCVGCSGTAASVAVSAVSSTVVDFSLSPGGSIVGTIVCERLVPGDWLRTPLILVYSAAGILVRAGTVGPPSSCMPASGDIPSSVNVPFRIDGLSSGQYYLLARDPNVVAFGIRPNGGDLVDSLYGGVPCVTECDVRRGAPVAVNAGAITGGLLWPIARGAASNNLPPNMPDVRMFDGSGVELVNIVRRNSFLGQIIGPQVVGLPPGTYYARLGNRVNGGAVCVDCPAISGTPIVIKPGAYAFTLNFGPPETGVSLSGTVTSASGGGPLSTVTVELFSEGGAAAQTATTDLFGRYTLTTVSPGTYFLRTRNDRGYVDEVYADAGCGTCDARLGTPIVVAAADRTGLDFALVAGGVLSGSARDANGGGVAGVPVSAFTPSGALAGRTVTSAVGAYHLTLPVGSYRARADATTSHGAEIFSEVPCTSAACDLNAGTAIPVAQGGSTANVNFTLAGCSAMTLSPSILASAVAGRSYRQVLSVSGGTGPIAFNVTSGRLPTGVELTMSTGVLSGTPGTEGRYELTVSAMDAAGCATARTFTLDVQPCAFTLSPTSATVTAAGGSVTVTIGDACGSEHVSVTYTGGDFPVQFVRVQPSPRGQVSLTVDANTFTSARAATVSIGRRLFELRQAGLVSLPPFGSLDLPGDGWQVSGAVAVGGWALDDLEVARVLVYRDPVDGEAAGTIFLGTAVFVPGARPDVKHAYPTMPLNDRAGFGFMILTNMLPNQGAGGFRIHVVAQDVEGRETLLGSRTLFGLNASATGPFGTIDRPAQGETVAGQAYLNWGWALTPQPAMIPFDGSTIHVVVDGAPIGGVTYNLFRPDVSGAFPGLANTGGPVGYRVIDTTALSEGLHSIAWNVTDSLGALQGLGSRYFTVANAADAQPPAQSSRSSAAVTSSDKPTKAMSLAHTAVSAALLVGAPVGVHRGRRAASVESAPLSEEDVTVRTGEGSARRLRAGDAAARTISIAPLERLELTLGEPSTECDATWTGYLVKDGELSALPVGASLDRSGTFYWQPGPGFAGWFQLAFIRTDCRGREQRLPVDVAIRSR